MTLRPLTRLPQSVSVVRHFTPNWFTMCMGTGILMLMADAFPYPFSGQRSVAVALWWVDAVLFAAFLLLFGARLAFERDSVGRMLRHPVQSMFLGAIPMALAPLINGGLHFGLIPPHTALILWWIDAALAIVFGWLVPYLMFTRQQHRLQDLTAVWLIPVVASEVAAVSGGVIAPFLGPAAARIVVATSYALWALSVPLALSIIVLVFLRLALHKLPPNAMAASGWLVLGPIGTGALALALLGDAAGPAFAGTAQATTAVFARPFGLVAGFLLWGYGLWWWAMAWLFTLRYVREGLPFNLGWWGFTFPIGVYAAATLALAQQTGFVALEWFGALLVLQLLGFWCVVVARTVHGMYHGYLFQAPCLAGEA